MAKPKGDKIASRPRAKKGTPPFHRYVTDTAEQRAQPQLSLGSDLRIPTECATEHVGNGEAALIAPHAARNNGAARTTPASADLDEKIKELLRLAQEQGYLTYADI